MKQYDIDRFKRFLEDYRALKQDLEMYNSRLEQYELQIRTLFDVKGIRYDQIVVEGGPDPHIKERIRLDLIDRERKIEPKITAVQSKLDVIDSFRRSAGEITEAAFRLYSLKYDPETGERYTFSQEAERLYMSKSSLKRKIDKEIAHFLKVEPRTA